MSLIADARILFHMLTAKASVGADHQERLEAFYRGQRDAYDDFRRRLLHGRERMMQALPLPEHEGSLMDMGGGTGSNLEALGSRINSLNRVEIVDLCQSLLEVARERVKSNSWSNVTAICADAIKYQPEVAPDAITFSYSLTMIPDWYAAIDHAYKILKPGGVIGIVDFYVARKWPDKGRKKHSGFTRGFWPAWFSYDNVFLSPDHLPYLSRKFHPITVEEWRGSVPYMPGLRVPYDIFIGRKLA